MNIVILAAGQGTRMKSELPKVLVPINGKPMIEHLVRSIIKSGVDKNPIVVVSKDNNLLIKRALRKYDCRYTIQNKQLGTGHALASVKKLVYKQAGYLISFYGDHPFVSDKTITQLAKAHNGPITMMTLKLKDFKGWRQGFYSWGRVIRNRDGIKAIVEFKDADEETKKITEVNPGFYCFDNIWLWKNINKLKNINAQKEYYITDLVKIAFAQGLSINSVQIDPKEAIGVNTKEELERAEKLHFK
jgi:bifunctional UDP-N-acetylglucosamine pyrophosphorylase / glucosamine-1-phosphate N-acetyltransferase